jgi:hypothetical protein
LFDSYKAQGKNPFQPWLGAPNAALLGKSAHRDKSGRKGTFNDYGAGVKMLTDAGWARSGGKGSHDWSPKGDPMPTQRVSSQGLSSGNTFVGGANITIAPNITITSGGSGVDAHKVAQEAARIIERDLKVALLRKN